MTALVIWLFRLDFPGEPKWGRDGSCASGFRAGGSSPPLPLRRASPGVHPRSTVDAVAVPSASFLSVP